jgi:hypothetical protein
MYSNLKRQINFSLSALFLLSVSTALAGGQRNVSGFLEIPVTARVHQFNRSKIEVVYRNRIFIFARDYHGLPEDLEPRPGQTIQINFTLVEWRKLSEQRGDRVDLREVLK